MKNKNYMWVALGILFLLMLWTVNDVAMLQMLAWNSGGYNIVASTMVGITYVLRDAVHAAYEQKYPARNGFYPSMIFVGIGCVITYVAGDPFIAMASVAAYIASTTVDGVLFSTRWHESFGYRCAYSNMWAAFVDTIIFDWVMWSKGELNLVLMDELLTLFCKILPALAIFVLLEPRRVMRVVTI